MQNWSESRILGALTTKLFTSVIKCKCFKLIKFITEDYFTDHTNITTKLKQILFTKVIKMPSKELGFE